jgi:hypothetical protein
VETSRRTHVEGPAGRAAHGIALTFTLLFVLAAVFVSIGLVAYTAWRGDLANGLFAILFAVLSAKAALSWMLWRSDREPHESPK